jgi:hypothetical protein
VVYGLNSLQNLQSKRVICKIFQDKNLWVRLRFRRVGGAGFCLGYRPAATGCQLSWVGTSSELKGIELRGREFEPEKRKGRKGGFGLFDDG